MQGRLCNLLLTDSRSCFLHFSSLTVLVSGRETYPSHLFVIRLQEHLEVWFRIGAADGFVLVKRTLSYTRK